jgi:hypothetical protein
MFHLKTQTTYNKLTRPRTPASTARLPAASRFDADAVDQTTMRVISTTGFFQRAALSARVLRSDNVSFVATAASGVHFGFRINDGVLRVVNQQQLTGTPYSANVTVATPLLAGVAVGFAQLRGLTSADVQLVASTQSVEVTEIIDVAVNGAVSETLHGVPERPGQFQLVFGARFSDGTVVSSASMFASFTSLFRGALVHFNSSDPTSVDVAPSGGALVLKANSQERVRLTVMTNALFPLPGGIGGAPSPVTAFVDV